MNARDLPVVAQAGLPMSAEQVRDHVNAIQRVMQAVMKNGVHYGVVPGTDKPALLKPGAEALCKAFHIAPNFKVEDLSGADFHRYRITCVGVHQESGITLGEGMGSASSMEEKYKWRRAVCDEEFESTPEARRRTKFGKKSGSVYRVKQVRAEPADIDNTVLKMACKRAHVAMVLHVTAASDIFAQDIEDLPDHLREAETEEHVARVEQPRAKSADAAATPSDAKAGEVLPPEGKTEAKTEGSAKPAPEGMKKMIRARLESAGKTEADLLAKYAETDPEKFWSGLTLDRGNEVLKWTATPS